MIKMEPFAERYWAPEQAVIDKLCAEIPANANVLEIGPGHIPFPKATTFVDLKNLPAVPGRLITMDCNNTALPFKDKEFDFVYCRHVVEDMFNPFMLCSEMSRVAKAGFVEAPSPLVEMARGVDGGNPNWRGYNHHRFLVWPSNGVLFFMSKFPLIELTEDPREDALLKMLAAGAMMWNSRLKWAGSLAVKHLQCPQDFMLPDDYAAMISRAILEWHTDLKQTYTGAKQ